MTPEERLTKLGFELPPVQAPLASYVPVRIHGGILYLAGQGPLQNGAPCFVGKLGGEVTVDQGIEAARLTVLNALAAIRLAIERLDRIEAVLSLTAYVASEPDFQSQHLVANGASELLFEVLGERGRHPRVAIGTNVLPLNLPLEISMVVAICP
ncbi:MAG: RidA family protein [Burkholderiaceae bacterium]